MDSRGNPKGGDSQEKNPVTETVEKEKGKGKESVAPQKKEERGEAARHEGGKIHEGHGHAHHGPDFLSFMINLAGMAYMTMGLGEVPAEPNLPETKYIIDCMDMLKEKAKGNLSPEEEKGVAGLLYELKVNFSKVASGPARK